MRTALKEPKLSVLEHKVDVISECIKSLAKLMAVREDWITIGGNTLNVHDLIYELSVSKGIKEMEINRILNSREHEKKD